LYDTDEKRVGQSALPEQIPFVNEDAAGPKVLRHRNIEIRLASTLHQPEEFRVPDR